MKIDLSKHGLIELEGIGSIRAAFSVDYCTDAVNIKADERSKSLVDNLDIGDTLTVASTNEKCKIIKIDGLKIHIDTPVKSASSDCLLKNEIMIIN